MSDSNNYVHGSHLLVHSSLHWTDMGADEISFWPFTVKHVVWLLYNRVPNYEPGLTPMELITKQKVTIVTSSAVMSGAVLHMFSNPSYKMVRNFQSRIVDPGLGSSWGICMSILLLLLMFGT